VGVVIGIDTGGTFTDLVVFDPLTGRIDSLKTPSLPGTPGRAIVNALDEGGVSAAGIERFTHGTTVGTNALIERTGCKVAFVTTKGFEDTPFIQRINRKVLYDLRWCKPEPLVASRQLCLGLDERLDAEGTEVRPVDEAEVRALCRSIRDSDAEAVALCLLFSYVRTEHEERVKQILAEELAGLPVSVSHEVAPIWREYERASTTIADAYLRPLLGRYVASLDAALRDAGLTREWTLMKSNGGAMLSGAAAAAPIQTVMSGPAGGMTATQHVASALGEPNVLTLDMGGTSADVGILVNGAQRHTTEYEIEWGLPAAVPLIDIKSIGAGGGSIAWVDAGGFLRVGPRSAGAQPGPICYGRGGTEVTVTDANLLLGRLDPEYFLAGRMRLDPEPLTAALEALGEPMGLSALELAASIVEIANENMASAIKMVSLERGHDPRRFALLAFGGAGPLHAAALAEELGIERVFCPRASGVLCALGLAAAAPRRDVSRTVMLGGHSLTLERLSRERDDLIAAASAALGGAPARRRVRYELRYRGQSFELSVEESESADPDTLRAAFGSAHELRYGYRDDSAEIELVNIRVSVWGSSPSLGPLAAAAVLPAVETRPIVFDGDSVNGAVYRGELPPGALVHGPAVCALPEATLLVPPGWSGEVDAHGTVQLNRHARPDSRRGS
jgi:N-methylhydantoinase A